VVFIIFIVVQFVFQRFNHVSKPFSVGIKKQTRISKKLIQMATLAHKSYQGYLEHEGAKKRICEEEHLRDQLKSIQTSVEVVVTESKSLEALHHY
jgi:hypothetical protein